jgi:hypothetical protein
VRMDPRSSRHALQRFRRLFQGRIELERRLVALLRLRLFPFVLVDGTQEVVRVGQIEMRLGTLRRVRGAYVLRRWFAFFSPLHKHWSSSLNTLKVGQQNRAPALDVLSERLNQGAWRATIAIALLRRPAPSHSCRRTATGNIVEI